MSGGLAMDTYALGEISTRSLWVAFGFTLFTSLVFTAVTYTSKAAKAQVFNQTAAIISIVSALAYLIMSLGNTQVEIGFAGREFLWLHYADWAVTFPLTVYVLAALVGASWTEVFYLGFASVANVAAFFAASMATPSSGASGHALWALYTFGVVAFFPVLIALFTTFASRAAAKGAAVQAAYSTLSSIFVVAWLFWIAIWATSDGGNHMTPDQSTICYTVFDIIVKSVFGVVLVTSAAALEGAAGVGAKAE